MNLNTQQQAIVRHLLTLLSGLLMMHGFKHAANFINTESNIEEILALGGIVWSFVLAHSSSSEKAIVQKAAEIIPANSVIVGTSEAAPKAPAQVVPPEIATSIIRKSDITPVAPIQFDSPAAYGQIVTDK